MLRIYRHNIIKYVLYMITLHDTLTLLLCKIRAYFFENQGWAKRHPYHQITILVTYAYAYAHPTPGHRLVGRHVAEGGWMTARGTVAFDATKVYINHVYLGRKKSSTSLFHSHRLLVHYPSRRSCATRNGNRHGHRCRRCQLRFAARGKYGPDQAIGSQ